MNKLEVYGMTIDSEKQFTNGIYAHGELNTKCGYDLVWIPALGAFPSKAENFHKDGIYPCTFIYPNGDKVDAQLFIWEATHYYTTEMPLHGTIRTKTTQIKGLVVKESDTECMKDAREKWEKMSEFI